MLIAEFFKDQEIFITGGSGFIGKALIEKILRSCPDVGQIFVLIRCQKGKCAEERLHDILKTSLYDRVRTEQPQTLQKVVAIEGDCAKLGLGIRPDDIKKLRNVSIIYHSAASVRFDDTLRDAILLNTRGTYELIKIAETLEKLQVFVHVSTTYCNPDKHVVEEHVYPAYADWRSTIKLAETYSTETLNILNAKYSDNQPNTYTFTKSLSEQIINDFKDKLPIIIFRPSIVISSLNEPVAGWVDNFNGPIGLLVACGIGILRTSYGNPDIVSDFVPVDIVVRAMLIACYKKAIEGHNHEVDNKLQVYNCATALICPVTLGEIIEIGKKCIKENPFEKTLWMPNGSITTWRIWNLIRFITMHIFTAILVDTIIRFANGKPFLLKLQRRIYAANLALHFFITISWIFKNENFFALDSLVPKEEFDKFGFLQYTDVDIVNFLRNGLRGAKQYLLNEPPESSADARLRFKIFQILHYLIKSFGIFMLARFIFIKLF